MTYNAKICRLYGYFCDKKHKQYKTNRPLNMLSCSVDCQNSSQKKGGLPVSCTTQGAQRMTGEQHTGTTMNGTRSCRIPENQVIQFRK